MTLRFRIAALFLLVLVASSFRSNTFVEAQTAQSETALPNQAPAPAVNPEQSEPPTEADQPLPDLAPPPQENPQQEDEEGERARPSAEKNGEHEDDELPSNPPSPDSRPATETQKSTADGENTSPEHERANGSKPEQGPPLPASLVAQTPADELACQADLKRLGVVFETPEPQSGEDGCSLPYPVSVESFGKGILVEPPVVANCAVSLAAAKFLQTTGQQAAEKHFEARISSITNGSGYVCRPRRGTQKLSEHALGNALDIMSFTLSDDRSVVVQSTKDKAEADFLAQIRKAACGPFKTVLGPGSDADHADHFHLDLAERRNGGTFCQ